MKDLSIALVILGIFWFLGMASLKRTEDVCGDKIKNFLIQDLSGGHYLGTRKDSIVIFVTNNQDTLWETKTSQICQILRDSCKLNGRKVLVVKFEPDTMQWDTSFGKVIYFRTCP